MTFEEFLELLPSAKKLPNGKYSASCPCHGDENRKLSVDLGRTWILTHCYRGCSTEDIVAALGIRVSDLALQPGSPSKKFNRHLDTATLFVDVHRPKPDGLDRLRLIQGVARRLADAERKGGSSGGGNRPHA